jgi:geranyl-CoA carboxylase alpha subunit
MIAKLIAYGADREQARRRLLRAVQDCVIVGPTTNKAFLVKVLAHPVFAAGKATTAFIGQQFPPDKLARPKPSPRAWAIAAMLLHERKHSSAPRLLHAFRNSMPDANPARLVSGEARETARVTAKADGSYQVQFGDGQHGLRVVSWSGLNLRYSFDGMQGNAVALFEGDKLYLDADGFSGAFEDQTLTASARAAAAGDGKLLAPMDGRIVEVRARAGQKVEKGQVLVVLEAMKMQHQIKANIAGTVEAVAVAQGDQVAGRKMLLQIAPAAEAKAAE